MVNSYVVLITPDLKKQEYFYRNILDLQPLFQQDQVIGLGEGKKLYLVLRQEEDVDGHHKKENKGPLIITFQFDINHENILLDKLKSGEYKIRALREFPQYKSKYYFIEDADENEVCLEFCDTSSYSS